MVQRQLDYMRSLAVEWAELDDKVSPDVREKGKGVRSTLEQVERQSSSSPVFHPARESPRGPGHGAR